MKQKTEHLKTGERGEDAAANFLRERGLDIVARNYRWSRAEVDVIARGEDVLHFVEVKTRHWLDAQLARDAVTRRKQGLIKGAAGYFMEDTGYAGDFQFDIVVVLLRADGGEQVIWTPDAFGFEN